VDVSAIDTLLGEVLAVKRGENLLIVATDGATAGLAGQIAQRARDSERQADVAALPPAKSFYVEPPTEIAHRMRSANVILELASSSTYYSSTVKDAIRREARAFFLSGIRPDEFETFMLQVENSAVQALGQRLLALLRRSRRIEILSGSGCGLWASLGPTWARELLQLPIFRRRLNAFFDEPTGLCRRPGTLSSLAGQVSFSGVRATIDGRLDVNGAVFPPHQDCPLEEPFKIEVKAGRVVNVEPTPAGRRLTKWMDENARTGAREVMHFSLGLNPAARPCESILASERVFGALTIGIGYGARGTHTDLVVTSPSVWLDQKPLFKDGELVHPEIAFLKSALTRLRPEAQKTSQKAK